MTSPDSGDRLRQLRDMILRQAPTNVGFLDPADIAEASARSHQAVVNGTWGDEPTSLRVRLHGAGVHGHRVPADRAGDLIRQTQLLVRWIGARLRAESDAKAVSSPNVERAGFAEATQMFLQPQFGAGSVVFHLVAGPRDAATGEEQPSLLNDDYVASTLLDRSLQELLGIIASSQADGPDSLGDLAQQVNRMGPRVASQLKRLATRVTEDEIDLDLRWNGSGGRQRSANLSRRGALAIKDAVDRNRVKVDEIVLVGMLETVSTGKDLVRLETPTASYKMRVAQELGVTLGPFLHTEITARVERTVTWHNSGKESARYSLLSVSLEPRVDKDDDGSEAYVDPGPEPVD